MGYVDYLDQFGGKHRGGFGRHYDRSAAVVTFDERTATLNYDRLLSQEQKKKYRDS
jgi:hypothetical protein